MEPFEHCDAARLADGVFALTDAVTIAPRFEFGFCGWATPPIQNLINSVRMTVQNLISQLISYLLTLLPAGLFGGTGGGSAGGAGGSGGGCGGGAGQPTGGQKQRGRIYLT